VEKKTQWKVSWGATVVIVEDQSKGDILLADGAGKKRNASRQKQTNLN